MFLFLVNDFKTIRLNKYLSVIIFALSVVKTCRQKET